MPAVAVLSFRLLTRLSEQAVDWAATLLEEAYLADDVRAWAEATGGATGATGGALAPRDSNGVVLGDGDAVTLIKDLPVKGGGFTAKRGTHG